MSRIDDLLLLERAGELPPKFQADLDLLRSAGEVPPKEGAQAQAEPATMTKTAAAKPEPFRGVSELQFDPADPKKGLTDYFNRVKETQPGMSGARNAALPTALSIVGGVAGGAVGGPPGAVAGRAGGAMLGEYANQQLGLTEESLGQIAFAGGASVAGDTLPGIANAIRRAVAPILPGASTVLRRLGITQAEDIARSLRGGKPIEQLADEVANVDPIIPLQPIRNAAKVIADKANKSLLHSDVTKLTAVKADLEIVENQIKYLGQRGPLGTRPIAGTDAKLYDEALTKRDTLTKRIAAIEKAQAPSVERSVELANRGTLAQRMARVEGPHPITDASSFQSLRASMEELNALIAVEKINPTKEFGQLMQLKKGFWEALEKAAEAGSPKAMAKLKDFNRGYRESIAADTVDEIVAKNFGRALEGTAEWSSSAAQGHRQLTDAIRKDRFLADSFRPGDLERVLTTFDKIRQLPVRGAPAGADAGSKNILTKTVIGTSVGEPLGQAVGLPPGYGAAAGNLIAFGGTRAISEAIKTPRGTKMLMNMLEAPGGYTAPKAAALATFLRAQTAETKQFEDNFKAAMKDRAVPIEEKIHAALERDSMKKDIQRSVAELEY